MHNIIFKIYSCQRCVIGNIAPLVSQCCYPNSRQTPFLQMELSNLLTYLQNSVCNFWISLVQLLPRCIEIITTRL